MQPRQRRKIPRVTSTADRVEIEVPVAFAGADFGKYDFTERVAINVLGNNDGIAEENRAFAYVLVLDDVHRLR